MIAKSIREGSIYIKPNFLSQNEFDVFSGRLPHYRYIDWYQPSGTYYGNRFQAFPCYETYDLWTVDQEYYNIFKI